jgi:hypothetical protein
MLVRRKNIARYCQESNNEKLEESDQKEKWKPKRKK